jgi:hypothetical protein
MVSPINEKIAVEQSSATATSSERDVESVVGPSKYITKLDLRLLPLLGCTYTILFLDRTNSKSCTFKVF